jgi:zinc protease
VDRERGVVLSEERARDTPSYRVYQQRLGFFLKGQRPPTRYPIGKVEVLQSAPASELSDFYHRYYRPERTVLVAVGDFDVDAMEAKIKAKFADWAPVGAAGDAPNLGAVEPRKAEAKLVIEPGAPLSIQLAWIGPPDLPADSVAQRKRDMVEQLGFSILNRRLQRLARGAEPPFLGAASFQSDEYKAAEITALIASAEPGRWREALWALEQEQRRAIEYGVRQDELDREITEYRASLTASAAGAATRTPARLAGEIVASIGEREVVTNPAQDLALFEETVKGLKANEVSAALKNAFKGDGPLLFVASPQAVEGGEGALLAALESSRKTEVSEPATPAEVTWPYASFGTPGKVVETTDLPDLDATFVQFANGVRLTVKPTKFKDDEVLVRVNVGDGRLELPKANQNLTWAAGAYVEGGLEKISAEDMERVLASRLYGAQFSVTDDSFVFSGGTRPDDLDVQLQVLAAYVSEPGWRPQAFARLQGAGKTIHDQYEATDSGVLTRDLSGLLHPGDERWAFPTRKEIADAKLEDFKTQLGSALSDGPIEVVIVGDITVEKATEAVARTFGALAQRKVEPVPASQRQVAFPTGTDKPVVLTHKGRADQSIGYVAWRTSDFFANPQMARDTAVMGEGVRSAPDGGTARGSRRDLFAERRL